MMITSANKGGLFSVGLVGKGLRKFIEIVGKQTICMET